MFPFEQRLSDEEKKDLLNQYASLDFGYEVLYTEAEFKKRGFQVSRKRKDLYFDLVNGRRVQFDLMLQKNHERFLVDLDVKQKYQEDYFDHLDKVYQITNHIYIIAKDEQTLFNYTKPNCFKWIVKRFGGIDNVKGKLTFHFGTLEWLIVDEKIWETFEC